MSLNTVTGYSITCDGCQVTFDKPADPVYEFTVYLDKDQLVEAAGKVWTTDGAKWHCEKCPSLWI